MRRIMEVGKSACMKCAVGDVSDHLKDWEPLYQAQQYVKILLGEIQDTGRG